MKIAITTSGAGLEASMDRRFGRAAQFFIYDDATSEHVMVDNNQNLNAAQGAGIQAAENVVSAGADVLISGNCGPKAFRVLQAAGVKIYLADTATVGAALEAYRAGELKEQSDANVDGHWV